ncbi:MAG: type IV pilus assembly protein PilM [Kiritimatiellia bacterium]
MSKILTLNIGASKAVLAEYALSGKRNLTLTAYGSGELSAVDVNSPGAIAAALPSVLHQIMREKGIRPAPLVVSLGGQMVFPHFAKFPALGDAEKLEQLVRYEIEQNVPFPIDEIVCDHQFIGTTADGDRAALIVAAKLESVRAVTDAVRAAGLKPVKVDFSPIAVCNALKFAKPGLTGCSVVLDIGSKTTNLIILEDEKIYNRSIPVAGNTITKELAQAFDCSFEEAEQLKIERGYVALGGVTEDEDEVTDRVSKIIRTVLTRLHAEISRSINFYRSQQGGSAPDRLFLTGGCARLPQLDQFFTESLQVEVEFLNPFGKIGFGPKVKENMAALEADAFALTESVGLALRGMDAAWISINLMPPELVEEARAMKRIPFLVVGGVAFLAALGLAWMAERHGVEVATAQIARVEGRNNALRNLETQLKKELKSTADECAKCDAFQRLLWERSAELTRVRAVRESLIPGMWITEWTYVPAPKDNPEAPAAVRVTIRGWRDSMTKAEGDWAARNSGKKLTAAEIVQEALRGRSVFVADSVKVVAQKDVKSLTEFAIQMNLAPAPSIVPEAGGRKGKAAKK